MGDVDRDEGEDAGGDEREHAGGKGKYRPARPGEAEAGAGEEAVENPARVHGLAEHVSRGHVVVILRAHTVRLPRQPLRLPLPAPCEGGQSWLSERVTVICRAAR